MIVGGIITISVMFSGKIKSSELIVPEIELTVHNNVIDTLYVYKAK